MAENKTKYKVTSIGKIPNDWDCAKYTDVAELRHGYQFRDYDFVEEGIPVIKIGNLKSGGDIYFDNITYVDEKRLDEFNSIQLVKGDLLMALSGATIGKVAIIKDDYGPLLQNYRVGAFIPDETRYNKKFLYYVIQSRYVQSRVENLLNQAAQPNIGKGDFDKIFIPVPPMEEQTKIAQILSTWDTAIETLEKIIAKKERAKKALMQQLLTGKTRFKEFKGEKWKNHLLGDLISFSNGKAHESFEDENGQFILVTSKFVSTDGKEYRKVNTCLSPLYENDIVIVMSDIPNGRALAKCMLILKNETYALNQRIGLLRPHKSINSKFLMYLINRNKYFLDFDSGVGQTNLRKDDILNCPLLIPSLNEQIKIAAILTNADTEIETLRIQLDHYVQQKQGLMQQLLTGKIRVKI